jgi:hypothetical protein
MQSLHIKLLIIITALALPIVAYAISNGLFQKINETNLSSLILLSVGVVGYYMFGTRMSLVEKEDDHNQCDHAGLSCP